MSPDSMLVVGGSNYARTEFLNLTRWTWDFAAPFPNARQINSAKVVFNENAFYVFGAMVDGFNSEEILKFDFNIWSVVGRLQTKRFNYSLQKLGKTVYIVGGSGNTTNEKCEFSKSTIICKEVGSIEVENIESPTLFGFEQQECTIFDSQVDEIDRLFILFANSINSTSEKPTIQPKMNLEELDDNIIVTSTKQINKSTNKSTVITSINNSAEYNSTNSSSTVQANSETVGTSTFINLSQNHSKFDNASEYVSSSTLTTNELDAKSTSTETEREEIYLSHKINQTFVKFGVDSLETMVGSPYTIRLSGASSDRLGQKSCSVVHKGKLFLYGGEMTPRSIFSFNCLTQELEVENSLDFDFVDGACASNNRLILLCFANHNTKKCYKSLSPIPNKWWQKFISTEQSWFTHESITISMSSGKLTISDSFFQNS